MRNFTFKKGLVGNGLFAQSSFKSFVMLVVMLIMTASSAMAQDVKFEVIDGLRYLLETGTKTASVMANNGKYSGDIVVPEKVKSSDGVEYSITSLGASCFKDCVGLTSLTIPSSVTLLGSYCFQNCYGLTSITIPSSVTSLGGGCFYGCSGLTSITIPSSVTSLGKSCFSSCRGLTTITIPSSVTSLGCWCFSGCSSLTSVTIPSSVTFFDSYCFEDCIDLTSISIPSSVTSLGQSCFSGCSGLTTITIPSSVTLLDAWCFSDCNALETVYFKGKVPGTVSPTTGLSAAAIIKVPAEYLQDYKNAFGPAYKYIYAWNPDESGDGDKPVTPCANPSVSYESGKLKFACETAGAKYHYTITDTDITSDALNENGEVSLSAAYNISVYATADGYTPSEKTEATLYWINANLETANINLAKTRGIVASAHDGIVSISGLDNGEVVKFYAADGKLLGSSSAVGGVASCAVSEKMVIAKIGMDTIKVLIK